MTDTSILFTPFTLKGVEIPNRIAMAPMTRMKSPGLIPGHDVAAYYRRRAEGGTGLIITEGVNLADVSSAYYPDVPSLEGDAQLEGWKRVVEGVHEAGSKIFPQLWHVGAVRRQDRSPNPDVPSRSPSGLFKPGKLQGEPMTEAEIADTIAAYVSAARNTVDCGFDGLEVHGAHGYLIDQFFWDGTNERDDSYGGSLVARTRFAQEVVKAIRKEVGADFPIVLRFSQWKQQDYEAKLARSPDELEEFLAPLVDAGVDCFHCSMRRYWEPEFDGSTFNLAGWAKKITGLPSIAVGSVSLATDYITTVVEHSGSGTGNIDDLIERLTRGEFDLIAIGRALLSNPAWGNIVREGRFEDLVPYDPEIQKTLY
jgi:2,4-dienoyl-CoA reductase-like NADH-dependent reductase (Old Yellow Enzyme family)